MGAGCGHPGAVERSLFSGGTEGARTDRRGYGEVRGWAGRSDLRRGAVSEVGDRGEREGSRGADPAGDSGSQILDYGGIRAGADSSGWEGRRGRPGDGALAAKRGLCRSGHVDDFACGLGDCAGCGCDPGQSAPSGPDSPATFTWRRRGGGGCNLHSLFYCGFRFASDISGRRWERRRIWILVRVAMGRAVEQHGRWAGWWIWWWRVWRFWRWWWRRRIW